MAKVTGRRSFLQAAIALCYSTVATQARQTDSSYLPFDMIIAPKGKPERLVFAHWFFFPVSIDNKNAADDYYANNYLRAGGEGGKFASVGGYLRERPLPVQPKNSGDWQLENMIQDVATASAIGIDAFQYDILDISPASASWKTFLLMLQAVNRSATNFSVSPCIDATSGLTKIGVDALVAALSAVWEDTAILRSPEGEGVLSIFCPENWPVDRIDALVSGIRANGHRIVIFPVFVNAGLASENLLEKSWLVSCWSGDTLASASVVSDLAARSRRYGSRWCQPIWPQDFRPKSGWYTEAANSTVFREGWQLAIQGKADAANIITWNDYSEGSEMRPSTSIQFAFYDLAAYFISAFKIGRAPIIVRDVLYYFHRIEPTSNLGDSSQTTKLAIHGGPARDEIELVAFLKKPGRISITIGNTHVEHDAAYGISTLRVPIEPGRPVFRLTREGQTVIETASQFPVLWSSPVQDFLYHGGSSARQMAE